MFEINRETLLLVNYLIEQSNRIILIETFFLFLYIQYVSSYIVNLIISLMNLHIKKNYEFQIFKEFLKTSKRF